MEKRLINSFGSIVIPLKLRKELGIEGSCTLWMDIRRDARGESEIVIRKSNNVLEFLSKYKKWAEIISRISDCTVSIVWNDKVLSMSDEKLTEEFVNKGIKIDPLLYTYLRNSSSKGVEVVGKDPI